MNPRPYAARSLAPLAGRGSEVPVRVRPSGTLRFSPRAFCPSPPPTRSVKPWGGNRESTRDFGTAPQFYVLYTGIIALGGAVVLFPGLSLVRIMFWSQVINGLLLPVILAIILAPGERQAAHGRLRPTARSTTWCAGCPQPPSPSSASPTSSPLFRNG